jgi:hypothetical protein
MKFMMIVKANKDYEAGKPPDPRLLAEIEKHSVEMVQKGILLESGGLLPSSKGARIRVSGKKMVVVDGPFTETKELVGGFAILKASSKQEAIEMGKAFMQLHSDILGDAYEGELEIRQLFDFDAVVENCLGAGAA